VGASVTLVTPAVAVEPGQSVAVEVRIKNTGTVVDEFTVDVLGDAAAWATVDPPTISLFPSADGPTRVVFSPPRLSTTPAGQIPFGLRVRSKEDPAGSAVEEGSVQVGAFMEPHAELVPRTSRGSTSGSHDLAVDNRGNTRLSADIEAADPDRQLRFDVKPPAVVVDPGMASFARVNVRPAKRFWRGQPKSRQFQLYVRPAGGVPISLDGTMVQVSVLPPWFLRAVVALIIAAILLAVLWLTLLKPTIQSAASDAVASPLASLKSDLNQALSNAGLPTMPANGGGGAATPTPTPTAAANSSGATPTPGAPTPTPTPGVLIPGLGTPVDGRLDSSNTTVSPTGTMFVTDFVFSNPNGRTGALVILRNTTPLLQLRLENFRDYDLHFVTPIVVTAGQQLNLSLSCTSSPCDPAVFYSGYQRP
jgi:type II secretory pathway pseudopilin PulG